jgi:uncharacterized protein (TIGR03086 family)
MTPGSTTTVLTGGVALLERAMGYTLGGLQLVTPEAMSNRTPCRDWNLRALLLHMNESLLTLHEAVSAGRLGIDPPDHADPAADYGDPAVDPVATLRDRACRMVGAWANANEHGAGDISIADRALTPGIVAATGALEVAVHGWDVAQACQQSRSIPPALAEELLDLSYLLVGDADRPTRFAEPVPVPLLASPSDRLLGFLGRTPG